jgi:hypothetical protein
MDDKKSAPNNVHGLWQAAAAKGRQLRAAERISVQINDGVASFPDQHFAQIAMGGDRFVAHVFHVKTVDYVGMERDTPFFLLDADDPLSADPLRNEHQPLDLGDISDILKDSDLRPCVEAVLDILPLDFKYTHVVEAALWLRDQGGVGKGDSRFLATRAYRRVIGEVKRRRDEFEALRALFMPSQDEPT